MKTAEKSLIEILTATQIAFNKLVISKKNVRVVTPAKEADKQLIASIQHIGLIHPLVVIPAEKQGYYEVVAGGRRFGSLSHLVAEKVLSPTALIDCKIADANQATLISLSENLHQAMHPADTYTAYKELANQGKTEKEIASYFGHPVAQVKRLMKLGGVAPALIELYRAEKVDLEDLMAFCLTEDHEKQMECYKALSGGNGIYPSNIKKFILNGGISTNSAIAKFVTLAAYKKAGGGVIQDFFDSNNSYISDVTLIQQLAEKRLQVEADSLAAEGWKWVQVKTDTSYLDFPRKVEPDYSAVPQELLDRQAKAKARYDELEDKQYDDDGLTDDEQTEYDNLESELDSLDIEYAAYGQFTADQKAISGCVVSFAHNGDLEITRGCMRREDIKQAPVQANNENSSETGQSAPVEKMESNALSADLIMYYRQAFQANLLKHESLCFDILIYQIAVGALGLDGSYRRLLSLRAENIPVEAVEIEQTNAHALLEEFRNDLPLSWADIEDESGRFAEFCNLKKAEKMKLLTYCVAVMASASPAADGADSISSFVTGVTDFKMGEYWKPTEANYYSRLRKGNLLELGRAQCGEAWATANANAKQGALAQALASAPEMADWLPPIVR